MSPRRDEAVLGLHEGDPAQTGRATALWHRAGACSAGGGATLFVDRCALWGKWPGDRDVEGSVGRRNLARVREGGDGIGGSSGTQGGSGETPRAFAVRS